MSIFKRTLAVLFALVVFILPINISVCASAEPSLIVECAYNEKPLVDVEVKIYFVAKDNGKSGFAPAPGFEKYSVLINGSESSDELRALALALASYAQRDNISPYDYGKTDINGKVSFPHNVNRLEKGVYLVVTDDYEVGNNIYTTEPYLVFLTDDNIDAFPDGNVIAKPKFIDKETFLSTTVKVLKVWKDNETQRPEEIEIELILNGKIIDTVILNEEMNWRYTWNNLEEGNYLVCEKNVPQGYEVSISREGITFVIKNTAKETQTDEDDSQPDTTIPGSNPENKPENDPENNPENKPENKLPQTGMLRWPVPYLACAGLLFFMAGWVMNRKNELKNEK